MYRTHALTHSLAQECRLAPCVLSLGAAENMSLTLMKMFCPANNSRGVQPRLSAHSEAFCTYSFSDAYQRTVNWHDARHQALLCVLAHCESIKLLVCYHCVAITVFHGQHPVHY